MPWQQLACSASRVKLHSDAAAIVRSSLKDADFLQRAGVDRIDASSGGCYSFRLDDDAEEQ
jgi:hypothetical protein